MLFFSQAKNQEGIVESFIQQVFIDSSAYSNVCVTLRYIIASFLNQPLESWTSNCPILLLLYVKGKADH